MQFHMTQHFIEIASATCPSPTYGLLLLETCLKSRFGTFLFRKMTIFCPLLRSETAAYTQVITLQNQLI